VRLQATEGIVLVTAEAGGKVVTFSAQASASSFTNYPKQMRQGTVSTARDNMLAAVSSMIRYQQSRNELPFSLGFSDPAVSATSSKTSACWIRLAGSFATAS
jgi:hypothetical protein